MKILIRLLILAVFSGGLLFALSSGSGILSSGQEVILTPQDGHSLNVVRVGGSDANFDITMSNKGRVYYSAESQIDDIYLVFHNDVVPGDRIKIHVNSGSFRYSISPLKTLPKVVKNALYKKAQSVDTTYNQSPKKHKKPKAKRKKRIKKESEPILGEFVPEAKEPVKSEPKPIKKELPKKSIATKSPKESQNLPKPEKKKVLKDSFYNNFTNVFKNLVKSFSMKPSKKEKEKEKVVEKKIAPTPKPTPIISKPADDTYIENEATIIRRDFSKLPEEIKIFDDSELLKNAKIKKKSFPKIDTSRVKLAKKPIKIAKPTTVKPVVAAITPAPKIEPKVIQNEPIIETQQPELKKVVISEDRVISTKQQTTPSKPYVAPKPTENRSTYPVDSIDTGYKGQYADLNQNVKKEDNLQKPSRIEKSDGDKIVITKVIDKKKSYEPKESEDPFAGRVLGKMDDRVLGGGYNPDASVAKFGMKVTKNSSPVSAWIEVFKNGTKDRIKTFYTSNTNKIKKVKLPAGVYMIRATYRSKGVKFKKSISNIHLSEGGDITKHISFEEGKLRVVAKRGGDGLYVKVIAYKSGTHKEAGFEFSDRHSGVANLTLPSGVYDIEVHEHNNVKNVGDIRVGGAVKTINIDF